MKRTKLSLFNNSKKIVCLILSLLICITLFAVNSEVSYGESISENAFEIKEYTKNVVVTKDHSYKVNQTMTINLPTTVESIRMILTDGSSIVRDIESSAGDYFVSTESGTQYITIVSSKDLTEGTHNIDISYVIREVAEKDDLKDKFYYNALSPEWKQPIEKVDINVEFPDDFAWDDMTYYSGQFGIQDSGSKVKFDVDKDEGTVHIVGNRIPSNFGITLMGDLPNGYWENPLDGIIFVRACVLLLAAILIICFIMWFFGGRDPRVGKKIQTHPIEGISPAELGFIFDGKVMYKDIIALILYLGTKGYLRISEYAPRKYRLIRLAEPKGEEKFIRNAYNIIFEDVYENRAIDLDDAWPRLVNVMDSIRIDIECGFSANDMLARTPISKILRVISMIIAAVCIFFVGLLGNAYQFIDQSFVEPTVTSVISLIVLAAACVAYDRSDFRENRKYRKITIVLCAVFLLIPGYELFKLVMISSAYIECVAMLLIITSIMILALLMNTRGKGNAVLVTRYRSLRKFIYKAQPKTVTEYFREDNAYYYNMVPYAYLFSGLETWAKAFKWLGVDDPTWYSDDIEGHVVTHARHKQTTIDIARSVKSFCRTLETGFDSIYRHYL